MLVTTTPGIENVRAAIEQALPRFPATSRDRTTGH
jgi:hypothetical protein